MNDLTQEEDRFIQCSILKLFMSEYVEEAKPTFDIDILEKYCMVAKENKLVRVKSQRFSIDTEYSLAQIYSFVISFLLNKKRKNLEKNFNQWCKISTNKITSRAMIPTLCSQYSMDIYSKVGAGYCYFKQCPDIPTITLGPADRQNWGIITYRPAIDSLSTSKFGLLITCPELINCY